MNNVCYVVNRRDNEAAGETLRDGGVVVVHSCQPGGV